MYTSGLTPQAGTFRQQKNGPTNCRIRPRVRSTGDSYDRTRRNCGEPLASARRATKKKLSLAGARSGHQQTNTMRFHGRRPLTTPPGHGPLSSSQHSSDGPPPKKPPV